MCVGGGAGRCKGKTDKQIRKHCKRNEENRIDLKTLGVGWGLHWTEQSEEAPVASVVPFFASSRGGTSSPSHHSVYSELP